MSYKVVRDAQNDIVAFGPNDSNYEPFVKTGETLSIEENEPTPVINHTTATNYEIRKVIIGMGGGKIALVRSELSTAPDDVIEYWKHKEVFTITDSEVLYIKTALSLSDTVLQNAFNSAN